MKLHVPFVLCVCLVQMCIESVSSELAKEKEEYVRKYIHDHVGDVSERFITDALTIYDKFEGSQLVIEFIFEDLLQMYKQILEEAKMIKLDVDSWRKIMTAYFVSTYAGVRYDPIAEHYDTMKIYESIFSERLPPRITNGLLTLIHVNKFQNATTKDYENAVNFLYGDESVVIENPLRDIQIPNASDCPTHAQYNSFLQDKFKAKTYIKPRVLENVLFIIEKFPCNDYEVPRFLRAFGSVVDTLQLRAEIDNRSISACVVKEHLKDLQRFDSPQFTRNRVGESTYRSIKRDLTIHELILATRLEDDRFRGMIDFERAVLTETPIDDIQKSLEYVFIDVAPLVTNCSSTD